MYTTPTTRMSITLSGLGTALVLTFAGCSSSEEPSPMPPATGTPPPPSAIAPAEEAPTGAQQPTTDRQFAQQVIVHREAEKHLVEAALLNIRDQRVHALAEHIETTHGRYLEPVRGWLATHAGSGVVPWNVGPGEGTQMPGAKAEDAVSRIAEAQQGRNAMLWVKAMRTHHQVVVDIAETELRKGSDPDLRAAAERIRAGHAAEIDQLIQLQRQL